MRRGPHGPSCLAIVPRKLRQAQGEDHYKPSPPLWRFVMKGPITLPVMFPRGSTGVHRARHRRHHGQPRYYQAREALCAQGVRVSFLELLDVTHNFAARESANASLNWMNDRFRDAPARSSCAR